MEYKGTIIREKQIKELAGFMGQSEYIQTYMYGLRKLELLIENYNNDCKSRFGRGPVKAIFCRMKSAESTADKLEKKGYEISAKNAVKHLNDLAGIRVVCFLLDDVYMVDRFLAMNEDLCIIKRKDYIKYPKASGYQSIHLIAETENVRETFMDKVHIEIQLHTYEMHCWAERDHKLRYKIK